jgi:small-conductance mechanosensitive channel
MKKLQKIVGVLLVVLVVVTAYGVWLTHQSLKSASKPAENEAVDTGQFGTSASTKAIVDQSPLTTAQKLAQLAELPVERTLAAEAMRLGDFSVDLAFDNALHNARLHPPPLSAEAKEIEARLDKAEKLQKADQDRVKELAEAEKKTGEGAKRDALELDAVQAQADLDLDQDEVDDAKQDFMRAGGDLTDKIEALKKEHEETSHGTASAIPTGAVPPEKLGLIHRVQQWRGLHYKQLRLWEAKGEAEAAVARISKRHNDLDAAVEASKESLPELAHHSKKSGKDAVRNYVSAANKSKEESAALLKKTRDISEDQKTLAALDKRVEAEKELAGVYGQWIEVVKGEQARVLNRALIAVLIVLVIALIGLYVSSWIDAALGKWPMDRRQLQSLRTVTRVSLQIVALLLIALVVMGPPGELGTFLGLAGAGLTVALKDFIVGFIGWFVLMGKNGMRVGDWVEINGVSGEVAEVSPFHTVLMETGNWTDSGHPTGRRVTFMNSFAIEGHYFNFSTSGQWLWDELQVVLPSGKDPYPVIEAIQKKVTEATEAYAKQAEQEWQGAAGSRELQGITAAPAVSVKSVVGGIEVAVRYIARASERASLRAKLNQEIVQVMGA